MRRGVVSESLPSPSVIDLPNIDAPLFRVPDPTQLRATQPATHPPRIALLYGSFRFLVEFVREPDAHLGYLAFGWLTMGQVLSLPLVALGLFLLWKSRSAPTLQPDLSNVKPT